MKTLPAKELSLRPYHGRLFVAKSKNSYLEAHQTLFKEPDVLECNISGRFSGKMSAGGGHDEMWTYLVWGNAPHTLVHELSHAVLHVFERCGIDPREAGGEPFCYMLSQLMLEAR